MKATLIWSSTAMLGLFLATHGWALQTPGQPESQSLSPKVLAFLKPVAIADGDSDLQKKLKERHNSGVTMLDERVKEYKKGSRDAGSVFQAAKLVADAKLDLAANTQERITVLEQMLDVSKLFEAHLQMQLDKGFGSKADFEQARFTRLSIEVDLLKAKQKSNP